MEAYLGPAGLLSVLLFGRINLKLPYIKPKPMETAMFVPEVGRALPGGPGLPGECPTAEFEAALWQSTVYDIIQGRGSRGR